MCKEIYVYKVEERRKGRILYDNDDDGVISFLVFFHSDEEDGVSIVVGGVDDRDVAVTDEAIDALSIPARDHC
jgi:hypothetical protein